MGREALVVTQVVELDHSRIAPDIAPVIVALCTVARGLSRLIAAGPLGGRLYANVGSNTDGDVQKALDVKADIAFLAALSDTAVRWFASEERDQVEMLNPEGHLGLAIDPLDGSSNIDANVSIGTIFGIMPAEDDPDATFLRPGRDLLAAGYFIYGPQTALVATFGSGVHQFILDPATDTFRLVDDSKEMPNEASEFAINASNYRHWSKPIRAYIDDCLAGVDGPRAENFNMRWVASLVAETHRIMSRGGIFSTPPTSGRDLRKADCGWSTNALRSRCWSSRQAGGRPTERTASST